MTRWSDHHRLRKYRRKKYNGGFNLRYAILYWRYHFKVHGGHVRLWQTNE
jgi:hypothetical protein